MNRAWEHEVPFSVAFKRGEGDDEVFVAVIIEVLQMFQFLLELDLALVPRSSQGFDGKNVAV